jgi:hypothetical protein
MFQVIYAHEWMNDAHDHEMQVQLGKTNTRGVTDAKCVTPGCTWHVHGHMPRTESNFIANIVQPHSCLLQTTLMKHKNMTTEFVANVMYDEIVEKVGMSPFRIMLAIQNRYGYEMSYDMAWRAKQLALEKRFGNYKDSYHQLPTLLATIQTRNPGTIIDIDDYINEKGDRVLKRVFWSLGCMIQAFKHCRPRSIWMALS